MTDKELLAKFLEWLRKENIYLFSQFGIEPEEIDTLTDREEEYYIEKFVEQQAK